MKYFLILTLILLSSCNEKSPTELPESIQIENFLPINENNFWYYQRFGFDNLDNRYTNPFAFDSLYYDTTTTYLGEECYRFVNKTSEDNYSNEYYKYYRIDEGNFYVAENFYSENGSEEIWLKIYDPSSATWLINSIETNFQLNGKNYSGRVYSEFFNNGKTSVEVKGNRSTAINTLLINTFTFQDTIENEIIPKVLKDTTEFILGEDIGIVSIYKSGLNNTDIDNGELKVLIDYHIEEIKTSNK